MFWTPSPNVYSMCWPTVGSNSYSCSNPHKVGKKIKAKNEWILLVFCKAFQFICDLKTHKIPEEVSGLSNWVQIGKFYKYIFQFVHFVGFHTKCVFHSSNIWTNCVNHHVKPDRHSCFWAREGRRRYRRKNSHIKSKWVTTGQHHSSQEDSSWNLIMEMFHCICHTEASQIMPNQDDLQHN